MNGFSSFTVTNWFNNKDSSLRDFHFLSISDGTDHNSFLVSREYFYLAGTRYYYTNPITEQNQWVHIAVVYDEPNKTITVYKDSQKIYQNDIFTTTSLSV